jgi:thiol-disulfide isomerase/thioredoxin
MTYIKFLTCILIASSFIVYYGCESNDTTNNSVYIPQPVNKKVLVDFFTNSGCQPCIAVHHYLDQITGNSGATINDTSIIIVSFHAKYPYIYDSLYRANTVQNDARAIYYGVNATPYGALDGVNMSQFSSSSWSSQLNAEMNTTKYLNISLSNTFNASADSGTVTANISLVNAIPSNDNVVHIIITENNISYITAPNGIKNPSDVMRYMITGSGGESINIGQNTTVVKNYGLSHNWKEENCYLTVYIQSTSTKQVFGVERIKIMQ